MAGKAAKKPQAEQGPDAGATEAPAAAVGFVVVWGCIQESGKTYIEGEPYQPPTPELEEELLKQGIIARAGTAEE
ncbi:hypothetical protein ACFSB1_11135 [Halopseudomonas phragmitis]|uniref:Uncharacterized protein n=1 Tax=Halopseudomonas phragmitis TaxID=1931241 RepID=A0A1V0B9L1_9GAMM|nr:hypothetical protein [Halopseudomonas phragmitis]AQZ96633.1 hypothetical protein BVH74_18575 [Halopseudomonas phragmitis]